MKNVVYVITVTDTDLTAEPWVDVFTERETAERYADDLCDRFEKYGVRNGGPNQLTLKSLWMSCV